MSHVRYVTLQGIIESAPGTVVVWPRRRSHRQNKYPLRLYGSAMHGLWQSRSHLRHFTLNLAPVTYETYVMEPVRFDPEPMDVGRQYI
jgi:hypothetical protein